MPNCSYCKMCPDELEITINKELKEILEWYKGHKITNQLLYHIKCHVENYLKNVFNDFDEKEFWKDYEVSVDKNIINIRKKDKD